MGSDRGTRALLISWLLFAAPAAAQPAADELAEPDPATCVHTAGCRLRGLCSISGEACAAQGEDCAQALACRDEGRCTATAGRCGVASAADCRESFACKDEGRCIARDGRCVTSALVQPAPPGAPVAAPPPMDPMWRVANECVDECQEDGECRYDGEECLVTDHGCWLSRMCREHGLCAAGLEECVALGDGMCRASTGCADDGHCFYNPEARNCDTGKERNSTGMMVAGIAMCGAGGLVAFAGMVFGFLGRLSGGDTNGGTVAIGVGAGVAVIGIPLAIAGGVKVKRRRSWTSLEVELAPGGALLRGSF